MKAAPFLLSFAWLLGLALPTPPLAAQEKSITVHVWLDDGSDTARPAEQANLEATRSLRLPPATSRFRQKLQNDESIRNKYVTRLQNAPKSIDIGIDKPGYHSLALCDLSGSEDHSIHVRLFSLQTPLAAPECFALKTQYELLFRREQQLAVERTSRNEVQHLARLKYADGVLALPNPNRPRKTQSRATQAMLARMEQEDEDGYQELDKMVDGLFDLYGMGGFKQYVPSRWQSRYWVDDRPVDAAIEILGTHGTYRTGPGDANLHRLEGIDFQDDNDEGGYFVAGRFRFKPGTPQEQTGQFHWKVDGQEFRETQSKRRNGQPSWTGTLQSGPYFPE